MPVAIVDHPIDTNLVLAGVRDERCGAEVLFVGTTRRWTQLDNHSVETDFLLYECYESMALKEMAKLETEARSRWPVHQVQIVHRVGRVQPEEPSVVIAVSSPHRREAFEAGQWLIDTLKHEIPIWKQEHYVQSGPRWIHPTSGSCHCDHPAARASAARNPALRDPAQPPLSDATVEGQR